MKDPVTGEVVDFEVTADPNAVSVPGSVASFSGLISLSVKEGEGGRGRGGSGETHFFKKLFVRKAVAALQAACMRACLSTLLFGC